MKYSKHYYHMKKMKKNALHRILWSFILAVIHFGKEVAAQGCELEKAEQIIEQTQNHYQNVSFEYNKTKRVTDSAIHLCLLTRENTMFDSAILLCRPNNFVDASKTEWKKLQTYITDLCNTFCPEYNEIEKCRDLVQLSKIRRQPSLFCESYDDGLTCSEDETVAPLCDFQIKEKLFTFSQTDVSRNFKYDVCDAGCSDLNYAILQLKRCWKHIRSISKLDEDLKCSAHRNFSQCLRTSSPPLCPEYTRIVSDRYTGYFEMEERCMVSNNPTSETYTSTSQVINKSAVSLEPATTIKDIPVKVSMTTSGPVPNVTEIVQSPIDLVTKSRTEVEDCVPSSNNFASYRELNVQICMDILDSLSCLVEKSVDINDLPADVVNEITRNFSLTTIRSDCSQLVRHPEVSTVPSTHPPIRTEMVRHCLNSSSILPLKKMNFTLELCLDLMNFLSCLYRKNIPEDEMSAVLSYISQDVTLSMIRAKCPAIFEQSISNSNNVDSTENNETGFECAYGLLTTICVDKKTISKNRRKARCSKSNSAAGVVSPFSLKMMLVCTAVMVLL